jgi:hypothetical protein
MLSQNQVHDSLSLSLGSQRALHLCESLIRTAQNSLISQLTLMLFPYMRQPLGRRRQLVTRMWVRRKNDFIFTVKESHAFPFNSKLTAYIRILIRTPSII